MLAFALPLIVFLVIVLLAALAALRRSAPKGPDGKRVKEPTCAACGYPARGLDTLTCPECGADFREAGILTPKMNTGPSLPVRLAMWSFAMLILYLVVSQVAFVLGSV